MFCLELQSHSSSPPRSSSSLCMQPWTSLSKQLYLFPDVDYDSFGDQHIFVPLSYLFMHYFADRLSTHTIIPTLALPDKAHDLIGHYTYYSLAHDIGSLIGRSYLLLLSITCPCVASHAQIKHTWILAAAGNIIMFCLMYLSWFHAIVEVEVILVLCFVFGVISGSQYANSRLFITEQVRDATEREFALGILTLGSSTGTYAAGLLGLFLKPYLTQHCLFVLGKNHPKDFSVSKDGSKAHTFGDTT